MFHRGAIFFVAAYFSIHYTGNKKYTSLIDWQCDITDSLYFSTGKFIALTPHFFSRTWSEYSRIRPGVFSVVFSDVSAHLTSRLDRCSDENSLTGIIPPHLLSRYVKLFMHGRFRIKTFSLLSVRLFPTVAL